VSKLNYLTIIGPGFAFIVSVISQFLLGSRMTHCATIVRIHMYLKKSPEKGLLYSDYEYTRIANFSDADWVRSSGGKRSTIRFCVFLRENLVSQKKSRSRMWCHHLVRSQEYRAATNVTCEMVCVRNLLTEFDFAPECPTRLYCESVMTRLLFT